MGRQSRRSSQAQSPSPAVPPCAPHSFPEGSLHGAGKQRLVLSRNALSFFKSGGAVQPFLWQEEPRRDETFALFKRSPLTRCRAVTTPGRPPGEADGDTTARRRCSSPPLLTFGANM